MSGSVTTNVHINKGETISIERNNPLFNHEMHTTRLTCRDAAQSIIYEVTIFHEEELTVIEETPRMHHAK